MSLLVFKILKPSSTFHGVAYNMKKEKLKQASLLHASGFGFLSEKMTSMTSKEARRYLDLHSSTNSRIVNKQFHAIMSCKGKKISLDQLKSYALEMMQNLGYDENPILIYGHSDTHNNHVHIITSRVDVNGKKIPHHFERKRSAEILQQITTMDKSASFIQDLSKVMKYHGTTTKQLQLLWELKGYQSKVTENGLTLFKYGTHAGELTKEQLKSFVNMHGTPSGAKKVKALLYKYKCHYSTSPKPLPNNYSTAPFQFKTDLTDFLHRRFGLQFLFFQQNTHAMPYGYTVIDHNHKTCYQGSQIMKLGDLITNEIQFTDPINPTTPLSTKSDTTGFESGSFQQEEQVTPERDTVRGVLDEFDQLIAESLQDGEKEFKSQKKNRKGSRKKFT